MGQWLPLRLARGLRAFPGWEGRNHKRFNSEITLYTIHNSCPLSSYVVHFWTLDGADRSYNLIPSIGGFVLQRWYVKYSMQLTEEGTTVLETLTLKFTFCCCSYVFDKDIIIIIIQE